MVALRKLSRSLSQLALETSMTNVCAMTSQWKTGPSTCYASMMGELLVLDEATV